MEMENAELEKLIEGFEHGSSRDSARGRAGRRGDMDEVSDVGHRADGIHRDRALASLGAKS